MGTFGSTQNPGCRGQGQRQGAETRGRDKWNKDCEAQGLVAHTELKL